MTTLTMRSSIPVDVRPAPSGRISPAPLEGRRESEATSSQYPQYPQYPHGEGITSRHALRRPCLRGAGPYRGRVNAEAVEEAEELDELLAWWLHDDELERQSARDVLDELIATSGTVGDSRDETCARISGESLMQELTPTDAARVLRALAGGQLVPALRLAHRHGGGAAADAVEHLIVDGLHLRMPAFGYSPDDPPESHLTAAEVARSARTGLGHIPPLGSPQGRLWDAMRLRVCAARRPGSWQLFIRFLAAVLLRRRAGQACPDTLDRLRRRRPPPTTLGPPGTGHYTAQPRLTRGPDLRPSLTSTHVEGRARLHAPRGSAVAA